MCSTVETNLAYNDANTRGVKSILNSRDVSDDNYSLAQRENNKGTIIPITYMSIDIVFVTDEDASVFLLKLSPEEIEYLRGKL